MIKKQSNSIPHQKNFIPVFLGLNKMPEGGGEGEYKTTFLSINMCLEEGPFSREISPCKIQPWEGRAVYKFLSKEQVGKGRGPGVSGNWKEPSY